MNRSALWMLSMRNACAPLFILALTTGMRRGELLGLTWECVDFKRNEILVMRSTTRYKDPVTGKPVHKLTSPKTFTSRRRISIMKSMIPILKQHMNDQRLLAVSPDWNPDNLVFCSSKGTLLEANTVNRNLARVIKNAELEDFSMHTLRHMFATRMLEKGVPAKVVQELLGHTDVTLTLNTYSHVLPSMAHDEMAKLEELFTENDSSRSDQKRIPATQQR